MRPSDAALAALIAHGEHFLPGPDVDDQREAADMLAALRQLVRLRAAARVFVAKYRSAPDGPLGVGLVNLDFFNLEAALDGATPTSGTEGGRDA
jgi:hypothetical protein